MGLDGAILTLNLRLLFSVDEHRAKKSGLAAAKEEMICHSVDGEPPQST
jgi:hypothetical protein